MDADRTGTGLGLPVLVAFCGALLGRDTRGGTVVVGPLNLGGSIESLPDELCTRLNIEFYKGAPDAVFKALVE